MNKFFNYTSFLLILILLNLISFSLRITIINEITLYYLLFLTAVTFHELGHFAFGKIIGMKLKSLYAGPIKICVVNNTVKLKENSIFALSNGLCQMFKCIDKNQVSRNFSLYYLGGIFTNLLLFIPAILISRIETEFYFKTVITTFGIMNFVIALATSLPFEGNDGWMALLLLKNDKGIKNKVWLQNIYLSDIDASELTEVEIDNLFQVFNTHKDISDIFTCGSLLALHYIKNNNYGLGKDYFMEIINIMKKQNKTNRMEAKSYIEVIDFQLKLLTLLEENTDIENFNDFDKSQLIKTAKEYQRATIDNRFREYIDTTLSSIR